MASRDIEQLIEPFRTSVKTLLKKAKDLPILVTETIRTLEEQKANVAKGVSWTLNSKHLTGEAVDIAFLVNGKLSYDAKLYEKLYEISKPIPYIIWPYKDLGWAVDKPHFQYDKTKKVSDTKEMLSDFIIDGMPADQRILELKEQVVRLQGEARNLTSALTISQKKEKENYTAWQLCLDGRESWAKSWIGRLLGL